MVNEHVAMGNLHTQAAGSLGLTLITIRFIQGMHPVF